MVELLTDDHITKEEMEAERFDDVQEGSGTSASEQEFHEAALRIIVQRNDFLLPNLIDMITTHKTVDVTPYYQRRARWDTARRARESLNNRTSAGFKLTVPVLRKCSATDGAS